MQKQRRKIHQHYRGDWSCRHSGALVVVSWMDKKPVNILSSYCSPYNIATVYRHIEQHSAAQSVRCPEAVREYITNMRGVDVFSQMESYARIGRKQFRWWPKLAWFLIEIAVMNAYVLYTKKQQSNKLSREKFRIHLAQQLISSFSSRKKRGRPSQAQQSAGVAQRTDIGMHTSIRSREDSVHSCTQCGRSRTYRKRTKYMCEQCNVYVCLGACMKAHIAESIADADWLF